MKKLLFILFLICPLFLQAGIIMKQSGDRLEDVTIKSVTDSTIVFILNGEELTIPKSEVAALLYDNGKYEEIKQTTSLDDSNALSNNTIIGGNVKEFSIFAFGNYIMKVYKTDNQYDGAIVEYRVIYNGLQSEPEWTYLGTTPFCYLTPAAGKNKFFNNDVTHLAEYRPLAIENYGQMKKLEFRLSKEGYKTVVVSPLIQFDFTGAYYFISLNKLKPLDDEETKEENDKINNDVKVKKSALVKPEKPKIIKERRMLLGLSLGIGIPFINGYNESPEGGYREYGGVPQLSFDFAYPIKKNYALGFYTNAGIGAVKSGTWGWYDRNNSTNWTYTDYTFFNITAGLLMTIGDFTEKSAFILGLGTGFYEGLGFVPEIRLGGLFKNGFYFAFDFAISPEGTRLRGNSYSVSIEPGVRFGYNFGNLFYVK